MTPYPIANRRGYDARQSFEGGVPLPPAPGSTPLLIPGCEKPEDLPFAYLNLRDHPRGALMLQAILDAGFRPRMVIEEDSPLAEAGRAGQLRQLRQVEWFQPPPAVEQVCAEHGISYQTVAEHNEPRVGDALRDAHLPLAVLGDVRILKPHIIDAVPHGIINVHPGLLPDVRGNNPYIWSIIHGLPQGATAHLIDRGVDSGPILLARPLVVSSGTSLPELILAVNELCAGVITDVLHQIVAGEASATPQVPSPRFAFREARPEIWALAVSLLDDD